MANAIEILINTRFNPTGLKQAEAETASLGRGAAALATGALPLLASALVAAGAAAIGAARGFASHVEQLGNLSIRTGVSVQNLQVLQEVMKRQGLDTGTATTALQAMNRAIAEHNPQLRLLGITATNAFDAILELADAFDRSDDTAAKNAISQNLLNRSYGDLLAILPGLRAHVASLTSEMDANGQMIKGPLLSAARELDAAMDKSGGAWEGLMTRIKAATASTILFVGDAFRMAGNMMPNSAFSLFAGPTAHDSVLGGGAGNTLPMGPPAPNRPIRVVTDDMKSLYKAADELQRLFGDSADQAYGYATALKALDDEAKRNALLQKLWPADRPRDSDRNMIAAGFGGDAPNARRPMSLTPDQLYGGGRGYSPITTFRGAYGQFKELTRQMMQSGQDMTDFLVSSFTKVGDALSNAIMDLFSGTKDMWQRFRDLIETLVQEVIRDLIRIYAMRAIFSLLPSPGHGLPVPGVINGPPAPGTSRMAPAGGFSQQININAFDVRDALQQLVRPGGSLREAGRRHAEVSAG